MRALLRDAAGVTASHGAVAVSTPVAQVILARGLVSPCSAPVIVGGAYRSAGVDVCRAPLRPEASRRGPKGQRWRSAVSVAAMGDGDDHDDAILVVHRIDDAVVPLPDAIRVSS